VQSGVNDHTILALIERFVDRHRACIEYMDGQPQTLAPTVVPSRELVARSAGALCARALERNYRGESRALPLSDGKLAHLIDQVATGSK